MPDPSEAPAARGTRAPIPPFRAVKPVASIGYLILVHRFPEQFERMFRAIHDPANRYVVHVDANADPSVGAAIAAFLADYPNAAMLDSRPALWGGYSLVDAELRGMARLLEMGADWEFFINLSGQDFPLKSQAEIRAFLSRNRGKEFIVARDQALHRPETMTRVTRLVIETRKRIFRTPLPRFFLGGAKPYIGNQWMIVSRKFCAFVTGDPSVDRFKRFYRGSFIADEGFFQTVIRNTPGHGEVTGDDLRMIDWVPDGAIKLRPRTYGIADAPALLASDNLFARKFDAAFDGEILDVLEAHLAEFDASPKQAA